MACPSRAWRVLVNFVVALTLAHRAAAQSPEGTAGERVRVELRLADSCAEQERFFAQVRERMGDSWEARPDELARTIQIDVSLVDRRYVARIELTDARGVRVVRAVAGAECKQVIDGIALITVLAIQAQIDELISRSEPGHPPPSARPSPPPEPKPANPPPPIREKPRARPPAESPLTLRLGARAGLQQGVGPELAATFGGFVGVAWERVALGLALDSAATGQVRAEEVQATFELLAARVEACWRWYSPAKTLTVEPGLFFQAGKLTAEGTRELPGVSQGGRGSTSWLAPGLLLAMRGELGPVYLGLEASAGLSLDRERFYLEVAGGGRRTVYHVPSITTGVTLGAGVVF